MSEDAKDSRLPKDRRSAGRIGRLKPKRLEKLERLLRLFETDWPSVTWLAYAGLDEKCEPFSALVDALRADGCEAASAQNRACYLCRHVRRYSSAGNGVGVELRSVRNALADLSKALSAASQSTRRVIDDAVAETRTYEGDPFLEFNRRRAMRGQLDGLPVFERFFQDVTQLHDDADGLVHEHKSGAADMLFDRSIEVWCCSTKMWPTGDRVGGDRTKPAAQLYASIRQLAEMFEAEEPRFKALSGERFLSRLKKMKTKHQ